VLVLAADNDAGKRGGVVARQSAAVVMHSSIAHAGYLLIGVAVVFSADMTIGPESHRH
jgi:NADH:ubiquinone oxidoreductase subunit 2 (subunit N)